MLPAEPGPFSDRPFAKGLLAGGLVALPIMGWDLMRHPRRVWLWGLATWIAIITYSAWQGAFGDDPDIDQVVAWGIVLGGLVGLPLIAGHLFWVLLRVARQGIKVRSANRKHRWRVEERDGFIEISRRKA